MKYGYMKKKKYLKDYRLVDDSIRISTEYMKTIDNEAYCIMYGISSYNIRYNKSYNCLSRSQFFINNYYKKNKLKDTIINSDPFSNLTLKDMVV